MAQAQYSSTLSQIPSLTNVATKITLNTADYENNVSNSNGDVTIGVTGTYFLMASPQVKKVNKSKKFHFIDFWFVLNGTAVADSGVRISMKSKCETDVVVLQTVLDLVEGDVVNVYMNVVGDGSQNKSGLGIVAIQANNTSEPLIPSIKFTLYTIAEEEAE